MAWLKRKKRRSQTATPYKDHQRDEMFRKAYALKKAQLAKLAQQQQFHLMQVIQDDNVKTEPQDIPLVTEHVIGVRQWIILAEFTELFREMSGLTNSPLAGPKETEAAIAAGMTQLGRPRAISANAEWEPGWNEAICCPLGGHNWLPGQHHLAPQLDCECGLYAYHPENLNTYTAPQIGPTMNTNPFRHSWSGYIMPLTIAGIVQAKGRIMVHGNGFRAQYARIAAIYGDTPLAATIATHLGVDVFTDPKDLGVYGREIPKDMRPESVSYAGSQAMFTAALKSMYSGSAMTKLQANQYYWNQQTYNNLQYYGNQQVHIPIYKKKPLRP